MTRSLPNEFLITHLVNHRSLNMPGEMLDFAVDHAKREIADKLVGVLDECVEVVVGPYKFETRFDDDKVSYELRVELPVSKVVRCNECRFLDWNTDSVTISDIVVERRDAMCHRCGHKMAVAPDGFCAWGERVVEP